MHNIWNDNSVSKLHRSEIITNFRYKALHNNNFSTKYDTAAASGIGANILHFKINKEEKNIILCESPPKKAIDLWLDEIIKNDISVFVTLTNNKAEYSADELNDLDPVKLEKYRNGQTVELHHIKNLRNNTTNHTISDEKILQNDDILEILECKVNNKVLRHIKFKNLDDAIGIPNMTEHELIEKFGALMHAIIKFAENLNVSFNCFMGVGRARFAAFLFLQFLSHKYKTNLDNTINSLLNNTVSYPYQYDDINKKIINLINRFE